MSGHVMSEFNRIKKERKLQRELDNLREYLEDTRVAKNDSFRMAYDEDGKFIRVEDANAVRDTYVMYFVTRNMWQSNSLDFYGTFKDFKAWYNKRNYVDRFLGVSN
jgi:hypothetical protein